MQPSTSTQITDAAATSFAANAVQPIQFNQQWRTLQQSDGYRGKVNMDLPRPGVSAANFTYPVGRYDIESSAHWGVGIVKRPFEVSYCASGSGSCGQRRIFASEVFVSEPNSIFDGKVRSQTEIDYVVISRERFAKQLPPDLKDLDLLPKSRGAFFSSQLLATLVETLLGQLNNPNALIDFYTDALVDAMVAELAKDVLVDQPSGRQARDILSDQEFARLEEFVADNLHAKIGLEDLSHAVGTPASLLRSLIKARTGTTPYQFILDARVRRAQVMLKTTQRSAAEIAFDCGFSSQSHMSDVFRQRLGKSPGQVRSS